jgi:hypothetical protein
MLMHVVIHTRLQLNAALVVFNSMLFSTCKTSARFNCFLLTETQQSS